jgi:hypothetical protein
MVSSHITVNNALLAILKKEGTRAAAYTSESRVRHDGFYPST